MPQHVGSVPAVAVLAAALMAGALVGCAAGESEGTATTASPTATTSSAGPATETGSATASPSDEAVEVSVQVRDGTVRPRTRRVDVPLGATVRLLVTSDVDDEVHVHGYEVEAEIAAGQETAVELVVDQPGLFEVETHESGLALVQLEVR